MRTSSSNNQPSQVRLFLFATALVVSIYLPACGGDDTETVGQQLANGASSSKSVMLASDAPVPERQQAAMEGDSRRPSENQNVALQDSTASDKLGVTPGGTSHCRPGWVCQAECNDGRAQWYDVGVCPSIDWGECTGAARNFCANWGWSLKDARWN